MYKFNNTHIFTGYLKQLLASVNIPTCKIYTKEFIKYFETYNQEDPRVVESIDTLGESRKAIKINYLKDDDIQTFNWPITPDTDSKTYDWSSPFTKIAPTWTHSSDVQFKGNNPVHCLTRTFKSSGNIYDSKLHNYLGDFLRFLRDYHDINLMSLYNCFDNKIYNNLYLRVPATEKTITYLKEKIVTNISQDGKDTVQTVSSEKDETLSLPALELVSNDPNYRIYAVPVKLFANYTIAIDSPQSIEFFCGFYGTRLDASDKSIDLMRKTYKKFRKTNFSRPFLYDCLDVKYWNKELESQKVKSPSGAFLPQFMLTDTVSRWDILKKEQDLKLFIKVPTACTSSIVVLEGDYRNYNDFKYEPIPVIRNGKEDTAWSYYQNTWKANFKTGTEVFTTDAIDPVTNQKTTKTTYFDLPDLNDRPFKPISKLQLLLLNTGESYPFADRLIEYLAGSAITPNDEISDNIKRAQKVMRRNGYHFKIDGIWEPKMQQIAYDYLMNTGPIETVEIETKNNKKAKVLVDRQRGSHPTLGHKSNASIFDTLGYIDKDIEKWYATWKLQPVVRRGQIIADELVSTVVDTIQDTDIYNGLYDI